jgi:lipoprotein-releasing system ATP-binding protein
MDEWGNLSPKHRYYKNFWETRAQYHSYQEIIDLADSLADEFPDIRSRAFYRIEELSGGEQQRVALARALVVKPDMLLADEPTGNLDKKNTDEVHRLLMDLNREFDMTMVIVTHNAGLADLMEKKVTIDDGKIVTF